MAIETIGLHDRTGEEIPVLVAWWREHPEEEIIKMAEQELDVRVMGHLLGGSGAARYVRGLLEAAQTDSKMSIEVDEEKLSVNKQVCDILSNLLDRSIAFLADVRRQESADDRYVRSAYSFSYILEHVAAWGYKHDLRQEQLDENHREALSHAARILRACFCLVYKTYTERADHA